MKITDILGTEYMTVAQSRDLEYFMAELLSGKERVTKIFDSAFQKMRTQGPPYVLDLAGARIPRDMVITLNKLIEDDSVQIVDSEYKQREETFKENRSRWLKSYLCIDLPVPEKQTEAVTLAEELSTYKEYKVNTQAGASIQTLVRWVLFLYFVRHDVSIDLGLLHTYFFAYAASKVNISALKKRPKVVLYDIGNTYVQASVVDDCIYDLVKCTMVPFHKFVQDYNTIPLKDENGRRVCSTTNEYYYTITNEVFDELYKGLKKTLTFWDYKH